MDNRAGSDVGHPILLARYQWPPVGIAGNALHSLRAKHGLVMSNAS